MSWLDISQTGSPWDLLEDCIRVAKMNDLLTEMCVYHNRPYVGVRGAVSRLTREELIPGEPGAIVMHDLFRRSAHVA